jgi:endonuclease/exonuclease/phosphatase family metal-dependent hydrolase
MTSPWCVAYDYSNFTYAFFCLLVGGLRVGAIGLPWNLREGDVLLAKPDLSPTFAGRRQLSGGYVGNVVTVHFSDAIQILAIKIINQNRPLFVFVTHWHASLLPLPDVTQQASTLVESGKWSAAEYTKMVADMAQGAAWRFSEAQKTVEFIRTTAGASPFVLMGDFNALDRSPAIAHLLAFGMVDAFRAVRPEDPGFTWDPGTSVNHQLYYRKTERLDGDRSLSDTLHDVWQVTPKRIDYIFVGPVSEITAGHLSVTSSRVVLNDIINGVHTSDHYGVFADISFDVSLP